MSRLSLSIALAFCLPGCETAPREGFHRVPVDLGSKRSDEQKSSTQKLGDVDGRLHQELPEPAPSHARCPDEALEAGSARNTLLLRVRDGRAERKSILPLELLHTLAPDELARWRDAAGVLSPDGVAQGTRAEPRGAELLRSLSERRFLGEIVIDTYQAPHNFRRLNALHSEWNAGRLDARLVVYDLESRSVLCVADVHARGDATGAPLARRLRESTRIDLERKLYLRAVREVSVAFSGITHVLRLPFDESLRVSQNDAP